MTLRNKRTVGRAGWNFLAALLLTAGCSKSDPKPVGAVAVEQVPATIQAAFDNASAEAKQQANEAVAALQSENDPAAFVQLHNLSGRPDLTEEQRKAAFASWMAVNARVQESAAKGNSAAQELLEKHRASK